MQPFHTLRCNVGITVPSPDMGTAPVILNIADNTNGEGHGSARRSRPDRTSQRPHTVHHQGVFFTFWKLHRTTATTQTTRAPQDTKVPSKGHQHLQRDSHVQTS